MQFWDFNGKSFYFRPLFFIFVIIMKTSTQINSLHSGLPRMLIEFAFALMVLSAVCTYGPVQSWMISHIPILTGLLNTAGMVVMYYAMLRGMKGLPHPLTALWWIAIGMNLLGFVFFCLGEPAHGLSAAFATLLPLIYLPLGILLLIWYRGYLGNVGMWMTLRILIVNLIPVLFYVTGLLEFRWGLIAMEVITISADLLYAWALRRVLVHQ